MTIEAFVGPALASAEMTGLVERVQASVVQVRNQGRGIGAGVIWDQAGLIITNQHVVAEERGSVNILLNDGREFEAQVIGRNPTLDLALLKVPANDLPQAAIGESTRLRVGELVFAIGHPWGQRGVVTAGIISGLGEARLPRGQQTAQYIRSDVRLAPGNSGGPLINADGAVVGINAMIFGGDLSVAIPSHVAKAWAATVVNTSAPNAPLRLGIGVQPVELRTEKPGETVKKVAGLLVVTVEPNSLAARNGLLVGDVVLEADGAAVSEVAQLLASLSRHNPAQPFRLSLMRGGLARVLEF